jgi:hypothetical protein
MSSTSSSSGSHLGLAPALPELFAHLRKEERVEEEAPKRCEHCHVRRARRRYCRPCGRKASALYNRELRREAKAAGEKYWLAWWEKAHGQAAVGRRRVYQAGMMRAYRRRLRQAA